MKRLRPFLFPAFLFLLCLLAYGLWIPRMGLYWDDFPISWIARTFGSAGLARYFSSNRPFWGLIYIVSTKILGSNPLAWQLSAFFFRWLSGLALWTLLKLVWPRRSDLAAWAAALFVIYPGFSQQFIGLVYTHFFIVLNIFLASLILTLLALRSPRYFWQLSVAAWVLTLANLLCMEYFFFLDLIRPILIWIALTAQLQPAFNSDWRKTLWKTVRIWLPYLVIFTAVVIWRAFFFGFHIYQPTFTTHLKAAPLETLVQLAGRIVSDAWLTTFAVWGNAFTLPSAEELTSRLQLVYWALIIAGAALTVGYAFLTRRQAAADKTAQKGRWFYAPILIGAFALIVCGAPFWVIDMPVELYFHFDRFTLSYMLGAILVVTGLIGLLPTPRWLKVGFMAVLIGFSIGVQYRDSISYIRDWNVQQRLFWQMTWRVPALEPGTTLLFNEMPIKHYSDNSLTAPLNWIYAPDNHTQRMSYILYYPTVRLGDNLPGLTKGLPFTLDYLAATFYGNTSQAVAFTYTPPGCLRVLDPEVEIDNFTVPAYLRRAMVLSSTAPILTQGNPQPPAQLYGSEPEKNWCYYFEKADLARQEKDWKQVAVLGDKAFTLNDYPNDPAERFPFIEGYANIGNWDRATSLTRESAKISPVVQNMLCRLWSRIERETSPGTQRDTAYNAIWTEYHCSTLEGIK